MAALAIVVATRDRAVPLRRLLASAVAMVGWADVAPELLVVDDGSRDATRLVVADVAARAPTVRYLAGPGGGKSRALNAAIRASTADLLAFVDDDVELDPGWLVAVDAYAARMRASSNRGDWDAPVIAAAQGAIRLPPEAAGNPVLAADVARWRTIPHCDLGPSATESGSLIGANMLVWRSAFVRIGLFDERLGPGAAGACEDTELARRIHASGGRIGWVPDAIVYHAVDRERLGPEYFRTLHASRGRSRIYYKRSGIASHILPNLGLAAVRLAAARLSGRPAASTRALGRWYHYRAMLAAARDVPLPGGVPRLEDA